MLKGNPENQNSIITHEGLSNNIIVVFVLIFILAILLVFDIALYRAISIIKKIKIIHLRFMNF